MLSPGFREDNVCVCCALHTQRLYAKTNVPTSLFHKHVLDPHFTHLMTICWLQASDELHIQPQGLLWWRRVPSKQVRAPAACFNWRAGRMIKLLSCTGITGPAIYVIFLNWRSDIHTNFMSWLTSCLDVRKYAGSIFSFFTLLQISAALWTPLDCHI